MANGYRADKVNAAPRRLCVAMGFAFRLCPVSRKILQLSNFIGRKLARLEI